MSQYKQLQHAGNEQVGIESVLQERIERIEMENYDLNEQLESWQVYNHFDFQIHFLRFSLILESIVFCKNVNDRLI